MGMPRHTRKISLPVAPDELPSVVIKGDHAIGDLLAEVFADWGFRVLRSEDDRTEIVIRVETDTAGWPVRFVMKHRADMTLSLANGFEGEARFRPYHDTIAIAERIALEFAHLKGPLSVA